MFELPMTLCTEEEATTTMFEDALSTSVAMISKLMGTSSSVVLVVRRERVGGSFTAMTLFGTTTLALARSTGRRTVMVRLFVPFWLAAGRSVATTLGRVLVLNVTFSGGSRSPKVRRCPLRSRCK